MHDVKRYEVGLATLAIALSGFAFACSGGSPALPESPTDASAGAPDAQADAQSPLDATSPCFGFGCIDASGSSTDASLGARALG